MKKVFFLSHPMSRFGVLAEMTWQLQQACLRCGIEAVLADLKEMSPDDLYEAVKAEHPDCTWSLNLFVEESRFFDPLGIPNVYLGVDGFTRHPTSLLSLRHTIPLFVDKETATLFSQKGLCPALWFPHAISKEKIIEARKKGEKVQDRPYDVVFLGSWIDGDRELSVWRSFLSSSDVQTLQKLADRALDDPSFAFIPEALDMFESSKTMAAALTSCGVSAYDLVNSVENYMRACDRERLLKTLSDRTVHIFTTPEGADILKERQLGDHCILHPAVPFQDVFDICCKAKVVINSSPSFREGFHERLLLSLAAGAIVVTSASNVLPSWLETSGAVVSYTTSSLTSLVKRLSIAEERKHPKEQVLDWLERYHTWDIRIQEHRQEISKRVLTCKASGVSS